MGLSDVLQSLAAALTFLCTYFSLCITGPYLYNRDGRISSAPMEKGPVKCLDRALTEIREASKTGVNTSFEEAWEQTQNKQKKHTTTNQPTPQPSLSTFPPRQSRLLTLSPWLSLQGGRRAHVGPRQALVGAGWPSTIIQRPYLQSSWSVFETGFWRLPLQLLLWLSQPYFEESRALLNQLAFAVLWQSHRVTTFIRLLSAFSHYKDRKFPSHLLLRSGLDVSTSSHPRCCNPYPDPFSSSVALCRQVLPWVQMASCFSSIYSATCL